MTEEKLSSCIGCAYFEIDITSEPCHICMNSPYRLIASYYTPKHTSWIKCSDRLPEDGQEVLCYLQGYCQAGTLIKGKNGYSWTLDNGYHAKAEAVRCWMPLPEFPKEVEE